MSKSLIITSGEFGMGCIIENHPDQLSDFRDSNGGAVDVVATIPLTVVMAATDLLAACEAALTTMPTGEYTPAQLAGQEVLQIREQLRAAIAKAKDGAE